MKLRWITVLAAALLSPFLLVAQTRVNPNSQINWPLSTGTTAPTAACTALNYGQPYTNITSGQGYTCTSLGWTASGGGGGSGNGTVNQGAAYSPAYYPAAGTAISGVTPFTGPGCYSATAAPALCTSNQLASVIGSGVYDPYGSAASAMAAAAAAQATANSAIPLTDMGMPNGVATLGPTGIIPTSQIPAIAITGVFPVATQAAMLMLTTATPGDVAIVTQDPASSNDGSYVLMALPASTLSNWAMLVTPSSGVQSVNGMNGNVELTFANIPGTITPAQLPYPTTTTLGGVEAVAPVANEWVSSINNLGQAILTQPTLGSFSGTLACSQLPSLTGGATSTGCAVTLTPNAVAAALAGENIAVGAVTATNMTNSSFTVVGDCVTVGAGGELTEAPCGAGGGAGALTAPVVISSTTAAANVPMMSAVDTGLAAGDSNLIQVGSANGVAGESSVLGYQYGVGGFVGMYGEPQATFNSTGAWAFPAAVNVSGMATAENITDSGLTTVGACITVGTNGQLEEASCNTGVQLSAANTWTALQTFSNGVTVAGTSTLAATTATTLHATTSVTSPSLIDTGLTTVSDCVIVGTGGLLAEGPCGSGAQTTVANDWTALQTFSNGITVTGTSTLAATTATTLHATTSITDAGLTTPGDCVTVGTGGLLSQATCGGGAQLNVANTWTAQQTVNTTSNNGVEIESSSTNQASLEIYNTSAGVIFTAGVVGTAGVLTAPPGSLAFTDQSTATVPAYLTSTGLTTLNLTDSALTTAGDCVTVGTGGLLAQAACGGSGIKEGTLVLPGIIAPTGSGVCSQYNPSGTTAFQNAVALVPLAVTGHVVATAYDVSAYVYSITAAIYSSNSVYLTICNSTVAGAYPTATTSLAVNLAWF